MIKKFILILFILGIIINNSCRKDKAESDHATPYILKIPKGFPQPVIPAENPLTVEGIQLGRMLYYDPILSSNGKSCSTCHKNDRSYSTPLFTTKTGEKISVPPHVNLAWNPTYNWDGSESTLEHLCLGDFGPDFFNTNMSDLVYKLTNHPQYPHFFNVAFNVIDISQLTYDELQLKIVYAISQFIRTMISSESKLDKVMKHEANFTPEEWDGFQTFETERGDCFHCHGHPLLTSNTFNNNGLDTVHEGRNLGRYLVTKSQHDVGKFSAPTLRNIELTAPYMHDGRFKTLEEVVEFYNSGVHWNSPNIDPLMTKPAKEYGLKLTPTQKTNLVKFLKTLTDTSFINNSAFKSPF